MAAKIPQPEITFPMEGRLDYENSMPLREHLQALAMENPDSTLILDMESLDFVGSSGIGIFVETLKLLKSDQIKFRLINVKPEFQKVFKLYELPKWDDPLPVQAPLGAPDEDRVFENWHAKTASEKN